MIQCKSGEVRIQSVTLYPENHSLSYVGSPIQAEVSRSFTCELTLRVHLDVPTAPSCHVYHFIVDAAGMHFSFFATKERVTSSLVCTVVC